jgi:hypothetical protein
MRNKKDKYNKPAMALSSYIAIPQGRGASRHPIIKIKSVLTGLLLISIGSIPGSAQTQSTGVFENLPVQASMNATNGTLGDIDALNSKLDDAIARSSASVDDYAKAINDSSDNFTAGASNRVEDAEMNCLLTCDEGLKLFIANGPNALAMHQQVTIKGDRIAADLGARIATRITAAKQLAQSRGVPVELVEVELTPAEITDLRAWEIVSDEAKYTEAGNRLHVDKLQQIIADVNRDREKLAADGAGLNQNLRRMEMLERVVKRFADDAAAEHRNRDAAADFQRDAQHFSGVADRYSRFTRVGEQSIQSRSAYSSEPQKPELGGPGQ